VRDSESFRQSCDVGQHQDPTGLDQPPGISIGYVLHSGKNKSKSSILCIYAVLEVYKSRSNSQAAYFQSSWNAQPLEKELKMRQTGGDNESTKITLMACSSLRRVIFDMAWYRRK
jgi:hypothetical protein